MEREELAIPWAFVCFTAFPLLREGWIQKLHWNTPQSDRHHPSCRLPSRNRTREVQQRNHGRASRIERRPNNGLKHHPASYMGGLGWRSTGNHRPTKQATHRRQPPAAAHRSRNATQPVMATPLALKKAPLMRAPRLAGPIMSWKTKRTCS
jgi:hypothetical protein